MSGVGPVEPGEGTGAGAWDTPAPARRPLARRYAAHRPAARAVLAALLLLAGGGYLYASTDNVFDPADSQLGSPSKISVHLKSLGKKILRLSFTYPTLASGNYYLIATIAPTLTIPEADTTNNVNASVKTFQID